MWGRIASAFVAAGFVTLIITEVIRSSVDRRRVRVHGFGGTQDIAIWGTLATGLCVLGAIITGGLWIWHR